MSEGFDLIVSQMGGAKTEKDKEAISAMHKAHERAQKDELKRLIDFRNKIRSLALSSHSLILKGIDVEDLRHEDMALFSLFEAGKLTLDLIAKQKTFFENIAIGPDQWSEERGDSKDFGKKIIAPKKLIDYMEHEIKNNIHASRSTNI
jgi:hypothetical protein